MNYREKIRKAIACPQFGDTTYGEWGILTLEQRRYIKRLLDELDRADNYLTTLYLENQELKKQLEDISEELELVRCDLHNRTSERDGYERALNECLSQQKEFIEYLYYQVKFQEEINDIHLATGFEEILSKYKEIIGVSDETN